MKLILLKIKNIASIEEAEIRFDEGLLASTSRFLICGDMGTGKSTILDSICLALYNNTPRLSQAPDDKRNYGYDNVTAKDPRNLLRHGTNEGSVELDFEGSDGKHYTARWSCGRTRNHTLRESTHTLTCGIETIGNKKEIEKRIKETAVGLDFQQFCRTTLLAQGQFTQFLKSKENEKSAILEKLTQTDIYSTVGSEIAKIYKEKEKEYTTLEAEIKGAQLLNNEEITELNDKITHCNERLSLLNNQKKRLTEKTQWLIRIHDAENNRTKADEKFQQLKAVVESTDFQNESKLISDWNKSSEGRYLLHQIVDLHNKQNTLETEQIVKGKQQFETASKMLNSFKDKLLQSQLELDALKKQIVADEPHSEMYRNVQTILAHLANALKHNETAGQVTQQKQTAENELPELKKRAEVYVAAQKKCAEEVKKAQELEQKLQQQLDELHPEDLEKANEENERHRQLLNTARQCCNNLKSLHESVSENDGNLQQNLQALSDEKVKIRQLESIAEERKNELARAKELLEKTSLALGDAADTLRAQLHIGDTCPVCGHTIEQLMDTAPLLAAIEPQKQNVKQAEERLTDTTSQMKASEQLAKKYQETIQILEGKKEELKKRQQTATDDVSAACKVIQIPINQNIENLLETIAEQEEGILKQKKDLLERQNKVNEQSKNILVQKEFINNLIQKEKKSELDVEKSAHSVKECESNISAYEGRTRDERKEAEAELKAAEKLISWKEWRKEWEEDPKIFAQKLKEGAENFVEREKNAEKLSQEIETQQSHLHVIEENRNKILEQWADWATPTEERLSGTDVPERWRQLAQSADRLHVMITQCHNDLAANEEKLRQFLQLHPELSRQRIEEISKQSINQDYIEDHQQQEKAFEAAKSALQQADRVLAEVREAPHPELTDGENIEILKEQMQQVEAEANQLLATQGEAQGRLKLNELNKQMVLGKEKQLEKLQHTANQWKRLSGLFGTNDGAAFRNVAQSFLLQNLVRNANEYLKELTQRYRLDCIPGTLTLSLRDLYQGETESPVDTLSGGESFLVSLSLALALSSINRKGFSIDILFIDEGFGNLSSNELETVLNMLARLQKLNGKRVGIISHVEAVKEHIPVHVEVTRIDPTRSKINIVDLSRQ
ncbi:MAG: AAA family ATPase [Bacteroidales bacterium]|nr:AAA family ATPase [Bacteroidales bacterium]